MIVSCGGRETYPRTSLLLSEKKIIRRSSGGGCGESVWVALKVWVSVEIRLTFWHDRRYPNTGDVIQPLISSSRI